MQLLFSMLKAYFNFRRYKWKVSQTPEVNSSIRVFLSLTNHKSSFQLSTLSRQTKTVLTDAACIFHGKKHPDEVLGAAVTLLVFGQV